MTTAIDTRTAELAILQRQLNESRLEVAVLSLALRRELDRSGRSTTYIPTMELFNCDNEFEAEYNIGGELILSRKNERM